jgi:hypothetical protein
LYNLMTDSQCCSVVLHRGVVDQKLFVLDLDPNPTFQRVLNLDQDPALKSFGSDPKLYSIICKYSSRIPLRPLK